MRREFLNHTLFWDAHDLGQKLTDFQIYDDRHRTHSINFPERPAYQLARDRLSYGFAVGKLNTGIK